MNPLFVSTAAASAIVDASQSADADGYNYTRLEQPVVLEPGQSYILASYESYAASPAAGDSFLISGTATPQTGSGLWGANSSVELTGTNQIHVFTMSPSTGQWAQDSGHHAPIVNVKLQ